jgi:dihydropyrimidinase
MDHMKQVLHGGSVVSGSGACLADLLIDGEKIAAVGRPDVIQQMAGPEAGFTDVTGCLLLPGFIDAHTHFDLSVAGTVTADDFASGTKAALKGGTTTVIDFATQYRGETLQQGLANWHGKADGKCSCDYGFHMSISEWNDAVSQEIDDMMRAGVTSFKLYLTYDTMVDDKAVFEILCRLKEVGGIAGVHCENDGLIAALRDRAVAAGRMGVASHPATRPAAAEAEAIDRLLRLAQVADAPVIIVHLTCREGYDVIEMARQRGQQVYAETCPQYLLLDRQVYETPGFAGAKYVCAPPLRTVADQEQLWQGLAAGTVQTVSTDHCSFTWQQRQLGRDDFRKIPGGLPGVETRGLLLYTYGVAAGRLSLARYCQALSENPARLYGLYPRKGVLAPGSDADIVVLRPGVDGTITAKGQLQRVDYSPYEGFKTAAAIEQVYLRGTKAVDDGAVVAERQGMYIPRGKYSL